MNNVSASDVIAGTPSWVFIMLAYLVWRGIRALQPRVLPVTKVWITPGIFILWGLIGLFERSGDFTIIFAHWLIGAVIGCALGVSTRTPVRMDRKRQLVWLPGSVLPLLRVLLIFGAHYALGVAAALHPTVRENYMNLDVYVSGASAGYFIGWGIRFVQSCNRAPHADLTAGRVSPQDAG